MSKYEVFSGLYFRAVGLNMERYKVLSPNAGKYGPGKMPFLKTFHAAFCIIIYSFACQFSLNYQYHGTIMLILLILL